MPTNPTVVNADPDIANFRRELSTLGIGALEAQINELQVIVNGDGHAPAIPFLEAALDERWLRQGCPIGGMAALAVK